MPVGTMRCMLKKIFVILTIFIVVLSTAGCEKQKTESISGTEIYFDTVVSITIYGEKDRSVIDGFFSECSRYEKIFSTTDEASELCILNSFSHENDEKIDKYEISEELYECIEKSLYFSEITDGEYDITIRPVSKLWDFHSGKNEVPDTSFLEEGLKLVDHTAVTLCKENGYHYISFVKPGIELELGSSAKGYIGDRLIEYLRNRGVESAIISLGGNIQCLGGKMLGPDNTDSFKVAIKDPRNMDGGIFDTVDVRDKAVVTSGIYERCFEKDGKLFHHILSARTGMPVDSDLASVTVITTEGTKADILSTVCFITGYEKSCQILQEDKYVYVKFIYKDGSSKEIGMI